MSVPRPVSLGDIAKKCALSRTAVSYALRGHPGIPAATRERVRAVANQLGYRPDPRMAFRMEQVRGAKAKDLLPLAWLNLDKDRDAWSRHLYLRPYLEGARERCLDMGYQLEEFWVRQPGMTMRRMSEILYHRGIQGVIVAPSAFYSAGHLRLQWKNFAAVSFDRGLLAPRIHRIIPDYFYNILLTLKILRRAGYRRIGVYLQLQTERRSTHAYAAGVLYFHSVIPEAERIAPRFEHHRPNYRRGFEQWFRTVQPDVIVCHHSELPQWLAELGVKVPEQVGVTHLATDDDVADWAGIRQRKREIGASAAEMAISQLQNYRFGLPDPALDTLIQGQWHPGKTLLTPKPRARRRR
jgi:LacI family transcriptional regulator